MVTPNYLPQPRVATGIMHIIFFILGCLSLPVWGIAQSIYHTLIDQPDQYLLIIEERQDRYVGQLAQRTANRETLFSNNEVFHLEQITAQVEAGKTYYLNMILRREPAFAKKLHQALDTTWLRATALALADLHAQKTLWQQVIRGEPLPLPSTFLAEADLIDVQVGEDVLEIGAGDGAFSLGLYRQVPAAMYWVNELDTALLDPLAVRLRQHIPGASIQLVRGQAGRTGMPKRSVDKVIMRQVLHHLSAPELMLRDIRQNLRADGQLFLLESYAELCNLCCADSWTRSRIQATLEEHGFQQTKEHAIPGSSFYFTVWEARSR